MIIVYKIEDLFMYKKHYDVISCCIFLETKLMMATGSTRSVTSWKILLMERSRLSKHILAIYISYNFDCFL